MPRWPRTRMLSRVWLFVTPWTVAHQAPLSMGFPRQEYWSGLRFPPPGDISDTGIEPKFPASPALPGGFFIIKPSRKPAHIAGKKHHFCVCLWGCFPKSIAFEWGIKWSSSSPVQVGYPPLLWGLEEQEDEGRVNLSFLLEVRHYLILPSGISTPDSQALGLRPNYTTSFPGSPAWSWWDILASIMAWAKILN